MCGSNQSRSALPIRLITSVVRKIASPGNAAIHHEFSMYTRPSPSILPHAGVGGCTPSPRKDRNDSRTITWATWRVAMTTIRGHEVRQDLTEDDPRVAHPERPARQDELALADGH